MKSEFKPGAVTGTILLAAALTLSACASGPQQTSTPYNSPNGSSNSSPFGTIESIQAINTQATNNGGGAIVGGIVGAVLGNQVGGGTGRTVATVAGAVGVRWSATTYKTAMPKAIPATRFWCAWITAPIPASPRTT